MSEFKFFVRFVSNLDGDSDEIHVSHNYDELENPPLVPEISSIKNINEKQEAYKSIENVFYSFFNKINSDKTSLLFMQLSAQKLISRYEETSIREYVVENGVLIDSSDEGLKYSLDFQFIDVFLKKMEDITKLKSNVYKTTSLFFINSCVHFDDFMFSLMKEIYKKNERILSRKDNNISIDELFRFHNLDDVKEYIIRNEIDFIMRKNHLEQIKYLQENLNIPEIDGNLISEFLELFERRNILLHNNSIISDQYINNARRYNYKIDDLRVGDTVSVKTHYHNKANDILIEISVILVFFVWSKLYRDKADSLHKFIYSISNKLAFLKRYYVSLSIMEFMMSQCDKKKIEENLRLEIIAYISAIKMKIGRTEEAVKMLSMENWSAYGYMHKLHFSVINNDLSSVESNILKLKSNNEISSNYIKSSFIFSVLENSDGFKNIFKRIFNEEYEYIATYDRSPF